MAADFSGLVSFGRRVVGPGDWDVKRGGKVFCLAAIESKQLKTDIILSFNGRFAPSRDCHPVRPGAMRFWHDAAGNHPAGSLEPAGLLELGGFGELAVDAEAVIAGGDVDGLAVFDRALENQTRERIL